MDTPSKGDSPASNQLVDAKRAEERPLTAIQARRLASISGIDAGEFKGRTLAAITDTLRWKLNPELFFMRKVCGRVVRKDPQTGEEQPVPFATVHVEDTDCSLLHFSPPNWPWSWFFPLKCDREVIATAKTDACGRFCVWIPRFDVDWVLKWRKKFVCYGEILRRPSLKDLLIEIIDGPWPPIRKPPRPEPDPSPIERLMTLASLGVERIAAQVGSRAARRIDALAGAAVFGAELPDLDLLEGTPAFDAELPPPLPPEFRPIEMAEKARGGDAPGSAFSLDAVRAGLATRVRLGGQQELLRNFDPRIAIGPFLKCSVIFVPEWSVVLDVPDITFRVTQDVNGDGVEETIYGEGYFQVRWDAGSIPDVTLQASPLAIPGVACEVPTVTCGQVPTLQFAGLMPLANPPAPAPPYFDQVSGYARRPNRPRPSGNPSDPPGSPLQTQTPMGRTLHLYGCVEVPGAAKYRFLRRFNGGPQAPVVGLTWPIYRMNGGTLEVKHVAADSSGWYPIVPASDGWHPSRLLLTWPTGAQGTYEMTLQLAGGSGAVLPATHVVNVQVDNSVPSAIFQKLAWKFASESDDAFDQPGRSLLGTCPVIQRGAAPAAVDVLMRVAVSAPHLRDAFITANGCSLAALPLVAGLTHHVKHWHTDALDNSELLFARYRIPPLAPQGVYSFRARANSRSFNPAGGDSGHLADWHYDVVYDYAHPAIHVAVIDA
ncbi:MAG TPA: hypothetical protein PKC43_10010 [Phycisphaerales bacterium]|nr:hypothetical protein [Phycisphaerales bacterium]HMP37769.1 hypothetical protein [Phycisphaerales bacterium]